MSQLDYKLAAQRLATMGMSTMFHFCKYILLLTFEKVMSIRFPDCFVSTNNIFLSNILKRVMLDEYVSKALKTIKLIFYQFKW